jgi:hypothetical protein
MYRLCLAERPYLIALHINLLTAYLCIDALSVPHIQPATLFALPKARFN